jgi:hypothetical protein
MALCFMRIMRIVKKQALALQRFGYVISLLDDAQSG